ncbi:MAG: MazG nucleotide pyrophosphohydrolase domain-containing protein [archaeon]
MDKLKEFYEMLKIDRKNSTWSAQNTFETRFDDLSSEIDEIKVALEKKDYENLKEELGDGLWDILFMIILAEEKGLFTFEAVIDNTIKKLKRRKPWIFSGGKLSIEEEKRRWAEMKQIEKSK